MGYFEKFLENPVSVILAVVLAVYVIKEGYELFKWWKNRADDYHGSRKADEDFHKQVCEIACTSEEHSKALKKIGDALEGINERLDRAEQERKEDTIANSRATLLHLYDNLKSKDSLTVSEYETFNSVSERYLAAGGNSVFRDKIIPEIRGKQIDDDGR